MTAPRLLVVLLLAGATPALATPAPPPASAACPASIDVRNLMTVTEYQRAGLEKLSKEQIAYLNRWLGRYLHDQCVRMHAGPAAPVTALPAATPSPAPGTAGNEATEEFGKPPAPTSEPNRIVSHIMGEFRGWTGDTVFHLENGQVWKQAGPGYFETDLKNPEVVIKKLLIGYVLQVHGYAKEVFVRRIR